MREPRPPIARALWWTATLGLAAVLALACTAPQHTLPADGPQTAEAVLARALARPLPATAQGMARLEAYAHGERRSVDVVVQIAMPDAVQLQAVSPTLDMLAVLATDGKRFVSFERGGATCSVGEACPQNLARLLPIALPPAELVPALLGRPPLWALAGQRLAWDEARGLYRVTRGDDAGPHQQVFVSPHDFRFVGTVLWQGAERLASLEYVGTGRLPETLRYRTKDTDVTVAMRRIELDQPIDREAFAIACPDGMLRQELPCGPPAQPP